MFIKNTYFLAFICFVLQVGLCFCGEKKRKMISLCCGGKRVYTKPFGYSFLYPKRKERNAQYTQSRYVAQDKEGSSEKNIFKIKSFIWEDVFNAADGMNNNSVKVNDFNNVSIKNVLKRVREMKGKKDNLSFVGVKSKQNTLKPSIVLFLKKQSQSASSGSIFSSTKDGTIPSFPSLLKYKCKRDIG